MPSFTGSLVSSTVTCDTSARISLPRWALNTIYSENTRNYIAHLSEMSALPYSCSWCYWNQTALSGLEFLYNDWHYLSIRWNISFTAIIPAIKSITHLWDKSALPSPCSWCFEVLQQSAVQTEISYIEDINNQHINHSPARYVCSSITL